MTLHVNQPSMRDAVAQVVEIAKQINADGFSAEDRANSAVSFVVEQGEFHWPLALQRQILAEAISMLEPDAPRPVPAAAPLELTTQMQVPEQPPVHQAAPSPRQTAPARPAPAATPSMKLLTLANEVVHSLLEFLDFTELASKPREEQESLIRSGIEALSAKNKLHLNGREVSELVSAVLADMLGLGPLEALLADDRITDIMVNGPDKIYVERGGKLELTDIRFRDNAHVFAVASRIVSAIGRRIDESQPMVDARLADGSRVNIAVPPLAIDGPTITIRKFPSAPVKLDDLIEGGSLTSQMGRFLSLAAYLRLNVLVSGGTGSGKTTLMNAMSGFIPEGERIVTIEDAAELRFQQSHVVRFETRPPNVEGVGEITMRTLVRNALRMRPDRIIIGEVRGDEVLDLLQAMNTGHDGSMSTLHANSPAEALTRVESMAALAGFAPGDGVVRRQLADAVHLIVQVSRMRDGKRRVTSISEVAGISGDVITLQELFTFRTDPASTRVKVTGEHIYSGYRPNFASRAADYGVADELDAILGN
ncbi:CpaF family protein [Sulfitobacter sp. F26204]|uniref:CpaF family protein n=1 Tax=Sulfitobacter sp. F26204 TaxID=2996014 RepID=UPI00225DD02D|nr:CpaF family protein [Sulfitobacter sp. F26204]MCX7561606.1 CpaF family protein [Sulfitobacter sp. F26204]